MTSKTSHQMLLAYLALAVGITSLSTSAFFVRWSTAPGPVTAFYRMTIASLMLAPFFIREQLKMHAVKRSNILFPILGGLASSGDLALWNTAVGFTTAANATLLGNTAPIWVTLVTWLVYRVRLRRGFWSGLTIAMLGAALVMGTDFFLHPRFGIGDLMAVGTGVFYAGYFLATERGRATLDPISYIWVMNVSASVGLFIITRVLNQPLTGFPLQTWLIFIATAIISQIIGYLSVSYALGHLPAAVVSPTMIGQPVLTAILAIPILGEVPHLIQVLGGVLALAGIYIVNQSHTQDSDNIHNPTLTPSDVESH